MYSKKELERVLTKNLQSELGIINFYLDNIGKLNYNTNKTKIDKLVFDSFDHAKLIAKRLFQLKAKSSKMTKKAQNLCRTEEISLKDIYAYEKKKSKDPATIRLLNKLIKEEETHEKIVDSLS